MMWVSQSLCCTPQTHIGLYVNHIPQKLGKKRELILSFFKGMASNTETLFLYQTWHQQDDSPIHSLNGKAASSIPALHLWPGFPSAIHQTLEGIILLGTVYPVVSSQKIACAR